MKSSITIVHIDNNQADIEYVKQLLDKQNYFQIKKFFTIGDFSELKEILKKEKVDIVLTDLNLTGFSGMKVLHFVKSLYPEISVIVLTGTGTEELAVEAIRKGADDYITKKKVNFERLPEKIHSILYQKSLEESLEEREKYLTALTNALPEAILDIKLPERTISYATNGVESIFGYKPEELIGKTTEFLFKEKEEYERLGEQINQAIKRKIKNVNFQTILKKKNNEAFIAEVTSTFVYNKAGKITKVIDIVRDITEEYAKDKELIFEKNKFQSLFETSVDAIFLLNKDGVFIDCNKAAERLFECKKHEIIGKSPLDFSPLNQPDGQFSQKKANEKIENALNNKPQQFEWVHKTAKGKEIICSVSLNAFNLENSKYITSIVRDITKTKQLEKELRNQNRLLTHIFSLSPAIVYTLNPENFTLEWYSENMTKILGYTKEEIKDGKEWWYKNIFPEDLKKQETKITPIFKDKHIVREYRFYKKNRELIWVRDELVLIEEEKDKPKEIIGAWIDITELKAKEQELQDRKSLLEAITDNAGEGIILLNNKGNIVFWNKACEKIFGYKEKEVLNKNPHSLFASSEVEQYLKKGKNLFTGGKLSRHKLLYTQIGKRKDGTSVALDISLSDFYVGNTYYVLAMVRDISEKVKMEKEIEKEKQQFEQTITSIEDAIIVVNNKSEIIIVNPTAEKIIGKKKENLIGKKLTDCVKLENEFGETCNTILKNILKSKKTIKLPPDKNIFSIPPKKDLKLSISISPLIKNGNIEGAVIVLRDITERIKLLETNSRISKLEAINTLAGGIAHDFNNMLTSLYGYLDLAFNVAIDPRVKNYISKSIKTSERAKALASRLLTLSKTQEPMKKVQDISGNIIDVIKLATSGSAVETEFKIKPLPFVKVDLTQIEEVIENIAINAVQAMNGKGKLTVSANTVSLKEKEVGTLPAGKYIRISIQDTGTGIPEEFREKIFEPFFTTKKEGTGLGLAASYSIIKKHDGWIDFESEEGKGTTFHIYLPVAKDTIEIPKKVKEEEKELKTSKGNFILMDDNPDVREVIKEFLYMLGYNVIEADRGEDVIKFYEDNVLNGKITINGIILDLVIKGGMGGKETCEKLRKYDKEIPIIAISGFSDDPIIAKPEEFGFTAAIAKPVSLKKFSETIEKVMKN